MTCPEIRERLLDHLYDALDDAESAEVRRHLEGCAACRDALAAAARQRDVLAAAARAEAGDVTFAAPPDAGPAAADGVAVHAARPTRRLVPRPWWIGIAAVVVAGLGLAGFDILTARSRAAAEHAVVEVIGPASVARGVSAEFRVRARDVDGDPVGGRVTATLDTGTGAPTPLGDVTLAADGTGTVALDPSKLAPGASAQIRLGIRAAGRDRETDVSLAVRESTRLVTRASTDKPLYRPGEPVRIRAVALESLRLTPAGDADLRVRVLDPKGGVAADVRLPTLTGVTAWEHRLPEDAPGGTWKLVVAGPDGSDVAPAERKFRVRAYRAPRFRFDVAFDRDSYRPGATGRASIEVLRAEGGPPTDATAEATVVVGGEVVVSRETYAVRRDGRVSVPFRIPEGLPDGPALLSVTVREGGAVESVAKTIPLVADGPRFEAFAEGGTLVAGLPNRVYFRARTPEGGPADLDAALVDSRGARVADVRSEVRGLGAFDFTPVLGETYRVVLPSTGALVAEGATLTAGQSGATLRALDDEVPARGAVRVRVGSTRGGRHVVGVWCRGVQIGEETVDVTPGATADASVRLRTEVGGVLRVTVFDRDRTPVAERLVARASARRLDVAVTPSQPKAAPRERMSVAMRVLDETGAPAQAILGLAVADASVLSLADDRAAAPMAFDFLVGSEVDEIEDAAPFAAGPGAARAVDRLLGVQGWRRFAWKDPASFATSHPDSAPRVAPVGASERPHHWTNEAACVEEVADATGFAAERALGIGILVAVPALFLGGIVVGIRGFLLGRKLAAVAAFHVSALVVVGVGVLLSQVTCSAEGMRALDVAVGAAVPGAWGPTGAKGEVEHEAVPETLDLDPTAKLEEETALLEGRARVAEVAKEVERLRKSGYVAENAEVALGDDDFEDDRPETKKQRAVRLVREYAHRAAEWRGVRDDFAEVLAWSPLLVTDAKGEATFEFDTSDAITSFRVLVDAHDGRGALGSGAAEFSNRVPFFAEPKFPLALTAGDEVDLPVVVANDSGVPLDVSARVRPDGKLLGLRGATGDAKLTVAAGARGRATVPLVALGGRGAASLDLEVSGGAGFLDRSRRTIDVHPRGFPIAVHRSGLLEKEDATTFVLPDRLNRTTLRGSLRIYPSTLATLVDGLDALLAEPHGCFEQVSSTNYPNVLVLQYLEEQRAAPSAVAARARDLLATGYRKLSGYECPKRGFEWFGKDPAHEGLTAYGVLEFADMAKVFDVDSALVERSRDWLLARRDGSGGFRRLTDGYDGFARAPQVVHDSYVAWALSEADGTTDLAAELALLEQRVDAGADPYVVALAANAFRNRGHPAATRALDRLAGMQRADGGFDAKGTSITSSVERNLEIETTALAALAFARTPERLANSEAAVRFLLANRSGGRFGATQATILALRALIAHSKASRRTATDHDLTVVVNGSEVAGRSIRAGAPGVVEFGAEVLDALVPGENRLEVRTTGAEALPWAFTADYTTDLPATDPACAVGIETSLASADVREGESVEARVVVTNRTDAPQAMTLARVGVPAGLEPRAERLEELKKAGVIDFFELRPREVVLYWTALRPKAEKRVAFDLAAAIPGRFEGPASSAYLYYGDDRKTWSAPLRVSVR